MGIQIFLLSPKIFLQLYVDAIGLAWRADLMSVMTMMLMNDASAQT